MGGRGAVVALAIAYFMSQFFRAFLAVLSQTLEAEIGATKGDLSDAQAAWFVVFALAQFPIGWALDRHGPRWTAAVLFGLCAGGGTLLFAAASAPWVLVLAMALIGLGCAPVLMASLFLYARLFDPTRFAAYAGMLIGFGTLGNVAASAPLVWAVEAFGWRGAVAALALICVAIAVVCALAVRNPPRIETTEPGGLMDLLRMPVLWAIFPMMFVNYAAAAGIRGLWGGPFLDDIHGYDAIAVGDATFVIALALALGSFFYAPLDRFFGTRKGVVLCGVAATASLCAGVAIWGGDDAVVAIALMAGVGFFGVSYPIVMAHARAFFPPHLVGRGVTLMNFCSIGGVGSLQYLTGRLVEGYANPVNGHVSLQGYEALFWFYVGAMGLALAIYALSRDAKP